MTTATQKKQSADWILMRDGGLTFTCQRCGTSYTFNAPVPLYILLPASKGFIKQHRRCRDRGRKVAKQDRPEARVEVAGVVDALHDPQRVEVKG